MDIFIELELNPFEQDFVSSSCCVSMTVVFVDRGAKQLKISPVRGRTIKKWSTVSSSTKVFSSLLFSSSFFLSTADFEDKYGRDTGLGCEDWDEYRRMLDQASDSMTVFIDCLSASTSEEEVRDMLEQAGKVTWLTINPSISHEGCNSAYVIFEHATSSGYTFSTIDNKEVEGERLAVRIVRSLEEEVRVFDVLA